MSERRSLSPPNRRCTSPPARSGMEGVLPGRPGRGLCPDQATPPNRRYFRHYRQKGTEMKKCLPEKGRICETSAHKEIRVTFHPYRETTNAAAETDVYLSRPAAFVGK